MLTKRFYRVDTSRPRDTGHTGLGLSIVKHILNRHNAQLKIESEINKGSKFYIVFDKI
jgi:two-component system phosphate regulon sensor histidine kinase PhoR